VDPEDSLRPATSPSRRRFLHACMGTMGVAATGIVGYPIVGFLGLPQRVAGNTTIELPLEGLSQDQAHYFDRQGVQIVVVYTDKTPKVFDAGCTHLGCVLAWDPNDHVFRCPCHGAIFDDKGDVVSGPVNAPLKPVEFEVKDKKIIIA
jgi:cytochrome b6-f complex iron-sulfur subunit